jgi:hypothetical protein
MPRVAKGHIEQLPSGSFRVSVYVVSSALIGHMPGQGSEIADGRA